MKSMRKLVFLTFCSVFMLVGFGCDTHNEANWQKEAVSFVQQLPDFKEIVHVSDFGWGQSFGSVIYRTKRGGLVSISMDAHNHITAVSPEYLP